MSIENERTEKGLAMMDEVYGPGYSATRSRSETPLMEEIVSHLFGEIRSRPALSIRDRRLLVMGATTALGRADLLAVQIRGALANDELTEEQLHEAALHLLYYVGIPNAGAFRKAAAQAIEDPTPRSSS